jgi:hypothetical protein
MVTTMDAGAAVIMAQLEGKRNIMAKRRVKAETATHRVACFTKVGITAEPLLSLQLNCERPLGPRGAEVTNNLGAGEVQYQH